MPLCPPHRASQKKKTTRTRTSCFPSHRPNAHLRPRQRRASRAPSPHSWSPNPLKRPGRVPRRRPVQATLPSHPQTSDIFSRRRLVRPLRPLVCPNSPNQRRTCPRTRLARLRLTSCRRFPPSPLVIVPGRLRLVCRLSHLPRQTRHRLLQTVFPNPLSLYPYPSLYRSLPPRSHPALPAIRRPRHVFRGALNVLCLILAPPPHPRPRLRCPRPRRKNQSRVHCRCLQTFYVASERWGLDLVA